MVIEATPTYFQWCFLASLADVDKTCVHAASYLDTFCLEGPDRFAVELLLREALTNAVVHGCENSAQLRVSGWLTVQAEEIDICVIDEGCGFPWYIAEKNVLEDLAESGRGLAIFRLYATSYEFNREGNQVTFRRKLLKGNKHD